MEKIRFGQPLIGDAEKEAVLKALDQRILTNGPLVSEFEEYFQHYTQGGIAVAVSSCMSALHISCLACLQPGDEVIVPALTHPATAHAVAAVGAKPVFADVDKKTGNITLAAIRKALTPETRAIMVVHYLGRLADMPAIMAFARERDLVVIEDCALALGARSRDTHAGLFGHAGCFSFYPVKHMTTCEGGMLLTKDPKMAEVARNFRAFGLGRNFGLNYRMSEVHAAIGLAQMQKVEQRRRLRQRNWLALAEQLKDFDFIDSSGKNAAYYGFTVRLPADFDREQVRAKMSARVETSVYYHPIVPEHPYYQREFVSFGTNYSTAKQIADHSICLSCGPHLGMREITQQAKIFKETVQQCMSC